jgi:hypothetical protein
LALPSRRFSREPGAPCTFSAARLPRLGEAVAPVAANGGTLPKALASAPAKTSATLGTRGTAGGKAAASRGSVVCPVAWAAEN